MKTLGIVSSIGIFILVMLKVLNSGSSPNGSALGSNARQLSNNYEGQWHNAERNLEELIRKEMSEQHIPNYLDIYIKRNHDDNTLALACTNDGDHYTYYATDLHINNINQLVDDGISKPKSLKY